MKIGKWQFYVGALILVLSLGTACVPGVQNPLPNSIAAETMVEVTATASVTPLPAAIVVEVAAQAASPLPPAGPTLQPSVTATLEPSVEAADGAASVTMFLSAIKAKTEHSKRPERFEVPDSLEHIAPPPENSWRLLAAEETTEFQTYDSVRISAGGEAWLDLGDLMHLLLKRDAEAQFVSNELAVKKLSDINYSFPDETPLLQRIVMTMHIYRGGFLGEKKVDDDGAFALTTPNAVVIISGTTFFIVYDPDAERTWVGNFDGTIDIADVESEVGISLPDRRLIAMPAVRDRTFWPIHEHMTYEEFERLIDLLDSPIDAAEMISGPYLVVDSSDNIAVHSGPGPAFTILGSLSSGDYARIIGQSSGWWQILCPAAITDLGTGCWVEGEPITKDYNTDGVPEVTSPTPIITPTITPTKKPVSGSCSSPILSSPGNGDDFSAGYNPVLSWTYDCVLGPDEFFDVRLWRDGDSHHGVTWTKDHFYVLDHNHFTKGRLNWSVAVIQGQDGVVNTVVAEEGPSRWFDWREKEPTKTPTPTRTPTPTPTITSTPTNCTPLCTGDVQVTLHWNNKADLDLWVIDPFGETINPAHPFSASGGIMDVDANLHCASATNTPVENIFWPKGEAPSGDYEVRVNYFNECENSGLTDFKVTILVDGITNEYSGTLDKKGDDVVIANFTR